MSETLSRRDFLVYSGAAVAGITLGEAGRRQLARADERTFTWRGPGAERWATSVCRDCPAGCGIRVRMIDDVPVKLEGNPRCPIARGRLCAKGQAAIESYFDPDRLTGPARRIGERGRNRWQPIAWDEGMQLLASRWTRGPVVADGSQPVALGGPERGPLSEAWNVMWRAAGAHVAWTTGATSARLRPALAALTGVDADPLFDLEHADHVLSFGAPIAEDWLSPLWAQRSYGRFRRGAPHSRGRLVQIDARRSLTARKADEWIGLPADRQVVLAYGLASVILREHRGDAGFLEAFSGSLSRFETEVVAAFSPDDVASLTGVPVVTVLRLARELAASPRPLVTVAADADRALVDAVFALNALVGAFDRAGGIMASPVRPSENLGDAGPAIRDIVGGQRRPAVLAFRDSSPLRAMEVAPMLEAASDTFIVSFSPYLDESAAVADLLLPTHTALESWHATTPPAAVPGELFAVSRPAVSARLNTRDLASVLKRISTLIGGPAGAASTWKTSEDIVRDVVRRLAALRRGGPYSSSYGTEWLRQLERGGWWVPATDEGEAAITGVLDAGGWGDPAFQPGMIREALRARGGLTFASAAVRPAAAVRPPAAQARADRARLTLVPFAPAVVNLAGNPNQPVLFELLGQPDGAPWSAWAELDSETARAFGIRNGARVRIASDNGSIEVVALLVDGMPPASVAVSYVPGVGTSGRWARLVNQDVRRLFGARGVERGSEVWVIRV